MFILWIKFAVCAGLITVFGFRLSGEAQKIVNAGKFSEGFMGVFFLAMITSFPELSTSVATVTELNAPDLGIGDIIGSVIFNIMIIVILDFKLGNRPILSAVKRDQVISCGFTLLMLGALITSLSLRFSTGIALGIFNIGLESVLLAIIYTVAMAVTYKSQVGALEEKQPGGNILKLWSKFVLHGFIIIAAGFWLAYIGKEIVDIYNWDEMYFGTIVIGLATSLPEIVVSIAAVSIGSLDMAIANILGSNLFDMFLVPVIDLLFKDGYVITRISISHIYSCLLAIILTIIVLMSIIYKPKRTYMRLGMGSIMLLITFIIGNVILINFIKR